MTTAPERSADRATVVARRLVVASAVMLFLELTLIRWLGANIVHLSYFSNFVLLGSFLGIGLGFLLSRRERDVLPVSIVVLGVLVALVHVAPVTLDRSGNQLVYFTSLRPSGPPVWLALPLVFLAVAAVMTGPGQEVGRCFQHLEPLTAYRWDLCGSLIGITSFTMLSALHAPPLAWAAVFCTALVWLLPGRPPVPVSAALVIVLVIMGAESFQAGTSWSPYYRVTHKQTLVEGRVGQEIAVNGVPHQLLLSARDKLELEPAYGVPYQRLPRRPLRDVLVVGAGSGSDVSIALSQGAEHIDAVDIDPVILDIGRADNPDRAYQSPRVTTHVDDGRAFLQRTHRRYDLILFALPDSLALVNGASAVRLESYLFTLEAAKTARAHLTSRGAFAMYNYYREPWIIERLSTTVAQAFGHEPCVDRTKGATGIAVIAIARSSADQACSEGAPLPRVQPVHDARPFLYFRGSVLPVTFQVTLALILLTSLLLLRGLGIQIRRARPYADLFFMGAAFLLLETRNVATFALFFGTTWIVNSIVFAGVLTAVLIAVEIARRMPPRVGVGHLYGATIVSLGIAWLVPDSAVLALPVALRVVAAVALGFTPVLLANLAFAERFRESADATTAFGVNVLGAMVGGCLEYGALLIGYHWLLLVVALLYLAAFVATPQRARVTATL